MPPILYQLKFSLELESDIGSTNVWIGKSLLKLFKLLIRDLVEIFLDNGHSFVAKIKLYDIEIPSLSNGIYVLLN